MTIKQNGQVQAVRFRFPDGTEIRADEMTRLVDNRDVQRTVVVEQGSMAPAPTTREFVLRGDVRMRLRDRTVK